jgi:hypothetical protein
MTTKSKRHSGRRAAATDAVREPSPLDVWSEKLETLVASDRAKAVGAAVLVAGAVVIGLLAGLELAVLTLAGTALLFVIWLMWLSLQSLAGETTITLDEAMALAAPSAEEERKRSVLRALKDLEYERSVGKISEQDYVELSTRYREEAKNLMRQLQEGNSQDRAQVERLVAERLAELGPPRAAEPEDGDEDEDEDEDQDEPGDGHDDVEEDRSESTTESESPSSKPVATGAAGASSPAPKADVQVPVAKAEPTKAPEPRATPTRRCAACSTRNELDAQFCKKCGARMAAEDQVLCHACPSVYSRSEPSCPDCGVRQEAE